MTEHSGDIVSRLRRWAIATDAVPASDLMDEAAREIEMLRSGSPKRHAGDIVNQLRDRAYAFKSTDDLSERAANEIERLQRQLATQECDILKRSLLELVEKWDSQAFLGGCSSGLDSETDRKSAATQGSAHSCCPPFDSAPVTFLTAKEREAIRWFSQLSYGEGGRVPTYAATLRSLLERTT